MEFIRSRQNPLVKHLLKLAESRRDRLKSQQALLVGTHLVQSALAAGWPLEKMLVCEGFETREEISTLLAQTNTAITMLGSDIFKAIEQAPSSTGLMAVIAMPAATPLRTDGLCLLLENIQDPGNVGTILRTAAAAGADQVWLTPGCADIWSPKVLRAAMSAHFHLSLYERIDPRTALESFTGPLAITTLAEAESLYATDLRGSLVLALGAEGAGISPELAARATRRIHIPMEACIESLNVAAAAAVCLFERRRQILQ